MIVVPKNKITLNLVLVLALIVFNAGGGMVTILGSLFLNDIFVPIKTIGFIIACFGAGSFIGGYTGGYMADYISPSRIVSFAILGNAIAISVFALTDSIFLFSVCMFCMGVFNSAFRPASILLLFEAAQNFSRSRILSLRRVALNIGFSLGSAMFGFLYSYNSKLSFLIIGGVFFLNFCFSFFISYQVGENKSPEHGAKASGNLFLFIGLNLLLIATTVILEQYKSTYPLYLEKFRGFSILDLSLMFSIHGILILIFQIPVGMISDKSHLAIGCFVGTILLGAGMGMTPMITSFSILILSCALWTFAEMIIQPLILPYILNSSTVKRGKAMGIYQACFSLGGLLGPIFGTFVLSYAPELLWNLCFIISLVCGIIFLIFYKLYGKIGSSI